MKKFYEGPEIEVRNYQLNPTNIVMTSGLGDDEHGDNNGNLNDGDDFDYFGN